MTLSDSMKANGKSVASSGPAKSVDQTRVSAGDVAPKKSGGVLLAPSTPVKPTGSTGGYSGIRIGGRGKSSVSHGGKGKGITTDIAPPVIAFRDVTFGPHEGEVRFRLIHFWEAWNTVTKVLIGVEMLLIDMEEFVIQGFIPAGKMESYVRHLKPGCTYRLHNFYGAQSKPNYRVADPEVTISFSWNSVLSELVDSSIRFPADRFRIHGFEEFDAACDMKGPLYDYIGHIKLVNGQVPGDGLLLDEASIVASRRVDLHVQKQDEPVLKLCLWDQAASEFCQKFNASGGTARVVLVTTLNPKRYGVLSLSSMTPSRVFLDNDVQETRDYLCWLLSHQDIANRVTATAVVKPEPATLGELFAYMKKESAKVAWFECAATIDDVVHGTNWYYIGCGECHTKATRGPTTLMCKKCGKSEIDGVAQYLSRLSVYDSRDQAVFVLLGDAGEELTGKKAAALVESYYEANDDAGVEDMVPVPQVMIDTIGQTRKFIVKVSTHNLTGKTKTLTVTKVLPLEVPVPEGEEGDEVAEVSGKEVDDHGDGSVKRAAGGAENEGAKRARSG